MVSQGDSVRRRDRTTLRQFLELTKEHCRHRTQNCESQVIAKRQPRIVAMKMQNELKPSRPGKVPSVPATDDATIGAGELLAMIK
jgi:hypothetical protein